ncbi:MAG: HD domain-containing phosphohydrolase, partial [Nitrospinota bacterium]|nr:HD domain-containing phosphohydrolase [Nitrospinota bacterium]
SRGVQLLPKEEKIFSEHPKIGHDLIVNLPHLEKVAKIIANQNKHYDFDEEASTFSHREVDVPFGVQVLRVAKDFEAFVSSGIKPAEALKKIRDKEKHYNEFIVDALASIVSGKPAQKTRSVKIDELSVGMIFVENLTSTTGQFICPKGTEIDGSLLSRIKNFSLEMEIVEPVKVIVPSTDRR